MVVAVVSTNSERLPGLEGISLISRRCFRTVRKSPIYNVRTGRLEEVKEATQVGRGIGLVEVPFVEPEAEVCQADLLGVLVESGPPVTHAVFESKVAIKVIDVMKPENA